MRNLRVLFVALLAQVRVEDLVFIDECGVNTNLVRQRARALRGQRAHGTRPSGRGRNVTVIAGVCLDAQIVAPRTYLGAMNGKRFLKWLEHSLLPAVGTGRTIIFDNLRVHHVHGVQDLIEGAGCQLLYLPPYSPDLNPIEMAWSKLKTYLRRRAERTTERVRRAVHWGLRTIKDMDVAGWFTHAGWGH